MYEIFICLPMRIRSKSLPDIIKYNNVVPAVYNRQLNFYIKDLSNDDLHFSNALVSALFLHILFLKFYILLCDIFFSTYCLFCKYIIYEIKFIYLFIYLVIQN